MKRALIVIGNHSPESSSVANCMNPLIDKLKEICTVDILTDRKRHDFSEHDTYDDINVYRVDDYRMMNTFYSNALRLIHSSGVLMLLSAACAFLLKSVFYVRYCMFAKERGTGGWELKRVYKKALELMDEHKYDFVISVSQPFISHYIGEKIKNKLKEKVRWIVFEFDPYSYNRTIKANKLRRRYMMTEEKRILHGCDKLFLTPELYDFYKNMDFVPISSKVVMLPYATPEQVSYNPEKISGNFMKKNKINCLYTGRLYEDIRSPKQLLKMFSRMSCRIHLTLMTDWSKEQIEECSPKGFLPSIIPFQNRDTANFNILQSDILVNIGNSVPYQVPGKLFEYMSTGKPIIHFSKITNDPALRYLERYPKVLVIKEWESEDQSTSIELEKYCENNQNFKLPFYKISEDLSEYFGNIAADKFILSLKEMLEIV